jgi:ribosomal-protein-alanine N-acetyltransferase
MELSHSTLNPASCRVAGNSGYRLEGTRRRAGLHADGWHDMHLHARLAGGEHQARDHRAGDTADASLR